MALGKGLSPDEIILKIKAEKSDAEKSVKSIKQELREAQQEALALGRKFGENSTEANQAAQKVANLRDEVDDFKKKIEALNPDKFARFSTATNGIVRGFQAAQGAAVLFGNDSKDLEKTLAKLQATMAFADGIQGVLDTAQAFSGLGNTIKTKVVQAFTTLKGAMIATGIGALTVGLGYLIANFDKVKKAVLNLVPGLATVGEWIGAMVNKFTDLIGVSSAAERQLEKTIETSTNSLDKYAKWLDANGDKYDKYTQKKYEADLEYQQKVLQLQKEALEKNTKVDQQLIKDYKDKRDRAIRNADQERKDDANKAELKRQADATAREKERKAELARNKKEAEDNAKGYKSEFDAVQKNLSEIRGERKKTKEEQDAEDRKAFEANMAEMAKRSAEQLAQRQAQREYDKQKEYEYRQALKALAIDGTQSMIGTLMSLNNTFAGKSLEAQKKTFKRNKTLATAEALISTYSATQKAYEAGASVGGPYALVTGAAYAAVALAAGLAKVAAIQKQTFAGETGGGSSVNTASAGGNNTNRAAQTGFSTVNAPTNNINTTPEQQNPKPIKVYVVQKDIAESTKSADSILAKAIVK